MSVLSSTEIAHLPPKEKDCDCSDSPNRIWDNQASLISPYSDTSPFPGWRGRSISEAADQIETLEADIAAATSEAARYLLEVVIVFGSIL